MMDSSSSSPQRKFRSLKLRRKPPPTAESGGAATAAEKEEEDEEEPLSPAARVFQAPNFNCHIIAIMGSKTRIDPEVVKSGLQSTMLKHPRFSSILVDEGAEKRWVRTKVNLEDHIIIPDIDPTVESPDQFVEDYTTNMTRTPLDLSKPLWELHLLNIKTSDAEAVGIFRLHHSIGDGVSLISLLLASTRKTSDPDALPTVPIQNRVRMKNGWSLWVLIGLMFQLMWNTIADIFLFIATMSFLKDTDTPIKGGHDVGQTLKRFVHRTVSFDDIKMVKSAVNTTINDVVLGVTQAGLTRYVNRRYAENKESLPEKIRLRSAILINIRPSAGIESLAVMMEKSKFQWGNCIGYIILPFNIAFQHDPLDYIRQAKTTIDRKKLSLESILSYSSAKLVMKSLGEKTAAALIHRALSNTTMSYSNVVGPLEEISFHGHPMTYLAASVYGHPHALTIHFQSYMDKMTIALAVDESVIPCPHQLLDDLEESLKLIKDAVVEETKQ